jgi:hypothetical protein
MLRSPAFPRGALSLHPEAQATPPPDAFGPFRVLHQIGAGALGPVFRAYEPEMDRLVAVKWFRLHLQPQDVHRLVEQFEHLVAADLGHPSIAAPLATGIAGMSAYLAQDFVAAESFDLVVRDRAPLPPADALRLAAQIAGALDFAGSVNIAHGALHPRDVLVSGEDSRVTGFGVARALERVGVSPPVRRPYASPERASGSAWDERADVFSLATLVYEMLWARRVVGPGLQAADLVGDAPGGNRAALHRALARALAEDPADRFPTAREFVGALGEAFPGWADAEPGGLERERTDARRRTRGEAGRGPVRTARQSAREFEPRLPLEEPEPLGEFPPEVSIAHGRLEGAVDADDHPRELPMDEDVIDRVNPALLSGPGVPGVPGVDDALEGDTMQAAAFDEPPFVRPAHGATPSPSDTRADQAPAWPAERHHKAPAAVSRSPESLPGSGLRPLALTALVFLAIGFAFGHFVGTREQRLASPLGAVDGPLVAGKTAAAGPTGTAVEPARPPVEPDPLPPAASAPVAAPAPSPPEPRAPEVREPPPATPGRLVVESTPPGAQVFVDGRAVGRTPLTVPDLSRGSYRVRVARDGFVGEERQVTISAARPTQSLAFDLGPVAPPAGPAASPAARLRIESRPAGARVFVDGKLVGITPLEIGDVPVGQRGVSLQLEGYQRWSTSVEVVEGEQHRVAASLDR